MSWFDKLFGEDNDSSEDYLNKRSQRRQKATQQEDQDSLLPQNNDVYERPKGKFRFPMRILEEANETNDVNNDTTEDNSNNKVNDNHIYRKNDDNISVNHKQRRRRHMYENDVSNNVDSQHIEQNHTRDETAFDSKSEHRSHKGKRMRIQTDVLRANATSKHKSNTPSYHQSDFKASEVPSAIFGTKKPSPLVNGVIKQDQEGEEDSNDDKDNSKFENTMQSDAQNLSSDDTTYYNDQYVVDPSENNNAVTSSSTIEQTEDSEGEEEQSPNNSFESTDVSKQEPLAKSAKIDNTINIENRYASQIVEEIRRERERKVLQKRQFKKALQQKRHEHQEKQEDSIQKAIDEMYAKQAQNYIGESSLDAEDQTANATEVDSEASIQDASNPNVTQNTSNDKQEDEIDSTYNYEEINLDNIRDIHTINDEYVNVDSETQTEKSATESHEIIDDVSEDTNDDISQDIANTPGDTSPDELVNSQSNEKLNDETSEMQSETEESQIAESVDNDIADAYYRELTDSDTSELTSINNETLHSNEDNTNENVETSQVSESAEMLNDTFESSSSSLSVEGNSEDSNLSHSEENTIDDIDVSHSEVAQDNKDISQDKDLNEQEINDRVDSKVDTGKATHRDQSTQAKSAKKKGSKPFNVVMTPSDKKRMLDARKSQNQNQVSSNIEHATNNNVSEPTTEQQKGHTISSERQNQAMTTGSDNVQHNTSKNDLNNTSDIEVETFSDETPTNTTENNYAEAETTTSNNQKSGKSDFSIDNNVVSNHQPVNPNEHSEQSVQEPLLKSEPTSQLGGTKTSKEDENKPTIRRGPNIKLPTVELLEAPKQHEVDKSWIEDKKQELNEAFYYFNVPAEVQNVTEGPSVTRFELSVEKGVKVSRITALQDDIKMALAAKDIRIEAPIAGTSLVGIEVPNQNSTTVNLRSIIEEPAFKNSESKLTVAMGLRINNEPLLMDISKTPHALIAGATGSGKSVCINSILMSLLYKNHPEELKLLLIDPKMVELAPYNDLPHLVSPVITDVKAATQSLKWAVEEMERRYKVFAKYHVRNITAFNKKATHEDRMPKIVIVIDELADLMMMAPQEVEQSIARIAQKARACGIHMLVATQRPSVNVITGLIKANIPTRVAFMVSSSVDSRTILDSGGAERLLGYGDMLYLGSGMNKPIRVQGTFVSDEEIDDVVDFIKEQREPEYLFEEKELLKKTESQPQDDLFDDVCQFMLNEGHISTSLIQRHFQIGYNRAARIVDQLEQLGYVSGANGSKPRDVYITESDLNEN
ncbi:DNA translocase FtsK [Staphylococcus shinii]|uniref:DNA translocase FtsK n=1 Tax=Staphylococcus shinii TaxID=2912228 RepID=UPI00298EE821|nr:DNA translocase FtsK [Staphylococcus shinii]MDW8565275.1 DNA translocase FtsK [Staphylococcus shinii]